MVSGAAVTLQTALEGKLRELEEAVTGLGDEAAGRRPAEGEWCVKEVLSHLCGDEGEDALTTLRRFLDEDTPLIGIVSGIPYYTPERQKATVDALLSRVKARYEEVGGFLAGLSEEQVGRQGRVPILRDTPIGEYATLAQWVGVLVNFHLPDHINQIAKSRG